MDKLKANPTPIVTEHFTAALMRDLAHDDALLPQKIAVAVSGGADSFALLHLTLQWAEQHNVQIIALTVDHHLRPESSHEAHGVAEWCHTHSIEHHILHWTEDKPDTGIQNAARIMRRKLLSEFCVRHSVSHLLLGHQSDDQAETFFMRLQRGSGLTGLSAIKAHHFDPVHNLYILRPLLSLRRADLRLFCQTQNLPFIDDPSNENMIYERARVRQDLAAFPELADGIMHSTMRLQRAEQALHDIAHQWLTTHLQTIDENIMWVSRESFLQNPAEIRIRILAEIILRITQHPMTSLGDIEQWHDDMTNEHFTGKNIAGCWARPKIVNRTQGIAFQAEPVRSKH